MLKPKDKIETNGRNIYQSSIHSMVVFKRLSAIFIVPLSESVNIHNSLCDGYQKSSQFDFYWKQLFVKLMLFGQCVPLFSNRILYGTLVCLIKNARYVIFSGCNKLSSLCFSSSIVFRANNCIKLENLRLSTYISCIQNGRMALGVWKMTAMVTFTHSTIFIRISYSA